MKITILTFARAAIPSRTLPWPQACNAQDIASRWQLPPLRRLIHSYGVAHYPMRVGSHDFFDKPEIEAS